MSTSHAFVVDVVRTPFGRARDTGLLADVHPVDMLASTFTALVERVGLDPAAIDDAYAGCVSQVGEQSLNIARNAVLAAGFPETLPATTIDRQCGSSMQALAFAAHGVQAGAVDVVLVGGVESMGRVPMFSSTLGADPFGSAIATRYEGGMIQQGIAAEVVSARWELDRETLDDYARVSHQRAGSAWADGVASRDVVGDVRPDEPIRPAAQLAGLGGLKPAFVDETAASRFPEIDWRVTAGNSSPLTDGAAAALVMSARALEQHGLTPRARIVSSVVAASDPIEMLTAVIPATRQALERAQLAADEIDAFEVNEAFACVPLVWQRELGIDSERLNPLGGAIAYGHPLGASGLRLLSSLLLALEERDGRRGLQTMCEAAGMANAMVLERC